jgi:hypothetical protein
MGSEITSDKVKIRFAGIDILKALAILFIPSLHFCSYFFRSEVNNAGFILMHMFRWMFFCGVGLFMIISGYLNYSKQLSKKYIFSIIRFYFIFLMYCLLNSSILHPTFQLSSVIYYATQYPGYFWYVSCWITMMFFIPFINKAIEKCSKTEYIFLCGALIVFLSLPIIPQQLEWGVNFPTYWYQDNFPILFYILGAGFKKFQFKIRKSFALAGILLTLFSQSLIDLSYCIKHNVVGEHLYCFNNYSNPFSVLVIFLLFALIYDVNIKGGISKCLAYISKLSLEMYLGLFIADYIIGPVRNSVEQWLLDKSFSYLISSFVWIFGELLITFTLALIIHTIIDIAKNIILKIKQNSYGKVS